MYLKKATYIKNIIFDLGNVLLDIDFSIMERNMAQVTGLEFKSMNEELLQMFYKFETGKIPYVVFFNYITKISPKTAIINDMLPAWNSMLLQIQPKTWDFLISISKKYNLYLLSNTNEAHVQWFENYLKKCNYLEIWNQQIFKKIYYSNEIGLRKPENECFEFVLNDSQIKPEETIFIDDMPANVEGATKSGLKAMIYDRSKDKLENFIL